MIQRHAGDNANFFAGLSRQLGDAFVADGLCLIHADDIDFGIDATGKGRSGGGRVGHLRMSVIGGLHRLH